MVFRLKWGKIGNLIEVIPQSKIYILMKYKELVVRNPELSCCTQNKMKMGLKSQVVIDLGRISTNKKTNQFKQTCIELTISTPPNTERNQNRLQKWGIHIYSMMLQILKIQTSHVPMCRITTVANIDLDHPEENSAV